MIRKQQKYFYGGGWGGGWCGDLSYKTDRSACRKFGKEPLRGTIKCCFVGMAQIHFPTLTRYIVTILTRHISLDHSPKGTEIAVRVDCVTLTKFVQSHSMLLRPLDIREANATFKHMKTEWKGGGGLREQGGESL